MFLLAPGGDYYKCFDAVPVFAVAKVSESEINPMPLNPIIYAVALFAPLYNPASYTADPASPLQHFNPPDQKLYVNERPGYLAAQNSDGYPLQDADYLYGQNTHQIVGGVVISTPAGRGTPTQPLLSASSSKQNIAITQPPEATAPVQVPHTSGTKAIRGNSTSQDTAVGSSAQNSDAQSSQLPSYNPALVAQTIQQLSGLMKSQLGVDDVSVPVDETNTAIADAKIIMAKSDVSINNPQVLLIVDRAVDVQRLWVMMAMPGNVPWSLIGAVKVSTGKPGRYEHYKTPVGVMHNDGSILGYRALGTKNKYGIRGIGAKGDRVWDFGWNTTQDWKVKNGVAIVRLEMHATDPTYLEPLLGKPVSEACIHIPALFNKFADHEGLLDREVSKMAQTDKADAWLLGPDHTQTDFGGDKVVVIDSSEPDAILTDPGLAQQMEDEAQRRS